MTIAVMRNVAPSDHLEKSFKKERCDVPLAPGLGLVLDEVKMTRYNKKFGKDGMHTPLEWESYEERVQDFKLKHILGVIHRKEKAESTMFQWLQTLKKHKFYTGDVLPDILTGEVKSTDDSTSQVTDKSASKDQNITEDVTNAIRGANDWKDVVPKFQTFMSAWLPSQR